MIEKTKFSNINLLDFKSTSGRILLTLLFVFIIQFGSYIPVPCVSGYDLTKNIQGSSYFYNAYSSFLGKNNFTLSLFSLGISPYITSTIIIQLLSPYIKSIKRLQKEEGEYGRQKLKQITLYLSLVWAFFQGALIAYNIRTIKFDWNFFLSFELIVSLVSGSAIIWWISEMITQYGIANGTSVIIFFNILSNTPKFNLSVLNELVKSSLLLNLNKFAILKYFQVLTFAGVIFAILYGLILIQESKRQIMIRSGGRLDQDKSSSYEEVINYLSLPVPLNQSGITPFICASSLLAFVYPFIKNQLSSFLINSQSLSLTSVETLFNILYPIIYCVIILSFTEILGPFFLNPKDIAEELTKYSYSVSDIKPGKSTKNYLKKAFQRSNMIGMSLVVCLTLLFIIVQTLIPFLNSPSFSLSSQMIIIGVTLEVSHKMKASLISDYYKLAIRDKVK